MDAVEQDAVNSCNQDKASNKPKHFEYLPKIASGELLAAKTPVERDCTQSTFNREIDEVKTESETRAIVFATIKNNTPLPPGAELDVYDKKWRSNGFKFKYLVEKSAGVWKVSQVYKFDESNKLINKDVWEKNYVRRDKPHVSAYVSVQ